MGRRGTVVAALLVLVALVLAWAVPAHSVPAHSVPLGAVLVALVLLVVPSPVRRPLATIAGLLLGLGTVLDLADLVAYALLAEPLDPLAAGELVGNGYDFLRGSIGPVGAVLVAVAAGLLASAVVAGPTWAVRRLCSFAEPRPVALVAVAVAALLAPVLIAVPAGGSGLARLQRVADAVADRQRFAAVLAADPYADVPADRLLTGLRGRDVVVAFVESYGVTALASEAVRRDLDTASTRLATAGFAARSGYLTSSTFGGRSWLAHASLLTGCWVDSQQRYRQTLDSDRLSLTRAFGRAGWRTVGVSPGTTGDWPEGAFYGFDAFHDARTLGYRGPNFSWATMPDQYTLAAFQGLERSRAKRPDRPDRRPVMAELQLVSSHAPWSPTPTLLDWDRIGDGSVYAGAADHDDPPSVVLTRDPARVRADYLESIRYSLASLVSYVETYGDRDLVLVLLGDHQPNPIVTGPDASADVPVTIVAGDPAVLARIDGWGWSAGLRPGPTAPVWRMDAFRDRFLAAYGPS